MHGGGLSNQNFGPIKSRPTFYLIKSIRKFYPKSRIILSTWYDEDFSFYEKLVDFMVLSKDPGTTIASKKLNKTSAINRHLVSSKKGLSIVNSEYTVLMRHDLYFKNNLLVKKIKNISNKKIIAISEGTIDEYTSIRFPFLFHVCDFIYAGRTESVKNLFEISNEIDSFNKKMYFEINPKPFHKVEIFNTEYIQRYVPESFVITTFLKKQGLEIPKSSYDISKKYQKLSVDTLINNFDLYNINQLGLVWTKNNNKFQYGLSGILGRYSRSLYLSRSKKFFITKFYFYFLHNLKIFYNLVILFSYFIINSLISTKIMKRIFINAG